MSLFLQQATILSTSDKPQRIATQEVGQRLLCKFQSVINVFNDTFDRLTIKPKQDFTEKLSLPHDQIRKSAAAEAPYRQLRLHFQGNESAASFQLEG